MTNQQRMYNVVFEVTDQRLKTFGNKTKVNATPMTHKEACTFKSKMMNHDHGYYMLEEIKTMMEIQVSKVHFFSKQQSKEIKSFLKKQNKNAQP